MNNHDIDTQAFKAEFDRNTRIAMQYADKVTHENTPKFIDIAERSVNMIHFDIRGIENWHLPFPKLTLITNSSIIGIVGNENDSTNKYMKFVVIMADTKQDFTGSVEIHRDSEKPQDVPVPQKHLQMSVKFGTGWNITMTLKIVHDGNGKFFHGYHSNTREQGITFGALLSLIHYFHPFCVDKEMFVVESKIARKKKGKIQTKGKSTYSIMHVAKVLKHFTPTGQSGKPLTKGYPRRAHMRKYRHDRWINMQGQTIFIKSTWVGPKTVLSEGRLYKVHTDIY